MRRCGCTERGARCDSRRPRCAVGYSASGSGGPRSASGGSCQSERRSRLVSTSTHVRIACGRLYPRTLRRHLRAKCASEPTLLLARGERRAPGSKLRRWIDTRPRPRARLRELGRERGARRRVTCRCVARTRATARACARDAEQGDGSEEAEDAHPTAIITRRSAGYSSRRESASFPLDPRRTEAHGTRRT